MASSLGVDEVVAPNVGGSIPFDDFEHVSLMSLPMVLGGDREEDFWSGTYLGISQGDALGSDCVAPSGLGADGTDEDRSLTADGRDAHPTIGFDRAGAERLGRSGVACSSRAMSMAPGEDMPAQGCRHGTRFGVCWQGARVNGCDAQRSIGRDEFWDAIVEPRLGDGVAFYSINPDVRLPDCVGCVNPELSSFVDTARVIADLDLVITVDTSVAHLAGAMGKPVWILLRFATDWRWCLNHESTSPWYPSARLFRQRAYGVGWGEVLGRVRSALAEYPQPLPPLP